MNIFGHILQQVMWKSWNPLEGNKPPTKDTLEYVTGEIYDWFGWLEIRGSYRKLHQQLTENHYS